MASYGLITHVASFICLAIGADTALGCFCCPPRVFTSFGQLLQAAELGDLRAPRG